LTVAETASIKVDSAATARQLQGTVALALARGAAATRWNASSNQPWLKVTQASGGFDTQPAWAIDTAAFGALANNAHHVAEITIGTDSNLPARTFKLDAHKALAEIKGLDAVALLAGQGGDLLVYGTGFARLPAGLDGISVAGAQPSAVTVLGDGVLRLTLPALRAGTYAVAARSASGVSTAARNLVVAAAGTYTYQALDTEGDKAALVWDAASKSVFVANRALKSVMRYADVNGRFQLVATRSFPAVDSIAMTPDRSALVLQSGYNVLHKLSPATLATIATFDLGAFGGTPGYYNEPLTILGDNRLMHSLWGWIDLDTGTATPLRTEGTGYHSGAPADWGIVSGNGLRMMRPDSGLSLPRGPIYRTDVLAGGVFRAYEVSVMPYFYRAAANHDGSVWVLEDAVVDFDLNVRGQAALPDGWHGNRSALSRDGTRLYRYAENSYSGDKPRVYVIDTSRTMTTQVNLPVLGFIELADAPSCADNWNASGNCTAFGTKIAISDDGRALFLAGDRKFIVQPIPASLAPGAGSGSGAAARVLMQGKRR
jgi:hypothetical protein